MIIFTNLYAAKRCQINRLFSVKSFQQARKSKEFYESEAKERRYFYLLDSRGQLFLEESKHKNYATCMKDKKFLDFFFRQLRTNKTGLYEDKPFVSLCGKEQNFLTVDDDIAPLVFSDLRVVDSTRPSEYIMSIGTSSLSQLFDIHSLVVHTSSGRMYHTIKGHKHLDSHLGLLHPSVADKLASHLKITDKYVIEWEGVIHEIKQLDRSQT